MNGNGHAEEDPSELTHEEQTERILTIVRSERGAGGHRDMQFGIVAAELSRNTEANLAATQVSREILTALKQLVPHLAPRRPAAGQHSYIAPGELAGLRRHPDTHANSPAAAEAEPLPGMRRSLDSYADLSEEDPADNTAVRGIRAGMRDMVEVIKNADRDMKAKDRALQEADGEARLAALELERVQRDAAANAIAKNNAATMTRAKNWTGLAFTIGGLVTMLGALVTWLVTTILARK